MASKRKVAARSTSGSSFLYDEWPLLVTTPKTENEEGKSSEEVTSESESDCIIVASSKAVSR
jgi:hypothetical protein